MMKLRLPCGVVHFDIENATFDFKRTRVSGNGSTHGTLPMGERFSFTKSECGLWVLLRNAAQDISHEFHFRSLSYALGGDTTKRKFMTTCTVYQLFYQTVRRRLSAHTWRAAGAACLLALSGCGYTLQNSRSNELAEIGIHRVFIAPLGNNSFKAGVEQVVFNSLQRTLTQGGRVKVVNRAEEADAVVEGVVIDARSTVSVSTPARQQRSAGDVALNEEDAVGNVLVASEYLAYLECRFSLIKRKPREKERSQVWSGTFARARPFPGSNALGILGNTSGLINDTEFDRALFELARSMMGDVHESMLARF